MPDNRTVFISHAEADQDLVEDVVRGVRLFPFEVYIALERAETGRIQHNLSNKIAESDVFVPFLTETSKNNRWVNQEIGHAWANGLTIIPIFESVDQLGGFIKGLEGVQIGDDVNQTKYEFISRLRSVLEPLQPLLMANWYLEFDCMNDNCREHVFCEIDRTQEELFHMHESGELISWACQNCGRRYHFDAATLEYYPPETLE